MANIVRLSWEQSTATTSPRTVKGARRQTLKLSTDRDVHRETGCCAAKHVWNKERGISPHSFHVMGHGGTDSSLSVTGCGWLFRRVQGADVGFPSRTAKFGAYRQPIVHFHCLLEGTTLVRELFSSLWSKRCRSVHRKRQRKRA